MRRRDVAVIGAGAAGLAAAGELARKGHQVGLFEARNRLGGRILTHRDERMPLPDESLATFLSRRPGGRSFSSGRGVASEFGPPGKCMRCCDVHERDAASQDRGPVAQEREEGPR
jgi:NADPH-dependent 2,4-dienoyl-CoA reductase/sulfur reductase-like enzyme